MNNYQNYATVVGYIKELLHNYNLPMVPVFTDETIPYKDRVYIKDHRVVVYDGTNFNKIEAFTENKEVLNLTKNLTINSSTYDNHTHEYLGDYLRFLRDFRKLDLMSMYNCFNGQQPSKIYHTAVLEKDEAGEVKKSYVINTSDTNYNFYIIPVKFNKVYTIALDSWCDYDITCLLYDNKFITSTSDTLIKESLKTISGSSFTNPYTYSTSFDCAKDNWKKEKILVMLLKLPKRINSSIAILEGDYTGCSNVIDGSLLTNFIYNEEKLPTVYCSKNSLLEVNNHINYPFSDRLVEYLMRNTIDSREDIPLNVNRIQENVFPDGIKGYFDVWDEENLRKTIHEDSLKEDLTKGKNSRWGNTIVEYDESSSIEKSGKLVKKFIDTYNDIACYVDKDVETMTELKNSLKTKILFDETDLYAYVVYGWLLKDIDIPRKEGYTFGGYFTEKDGKGTQCYDKDGKGIIRWRDPSPVVTLYPLWIL